MGDYTAGTPCMKLKIENEKNITINDLINEANNVWKVVRGRRLKFGDIDAAEALMSEIRKTNREFCTSYPIVLRYMCQMQEYDSRAFKKYLLKIKEHPWKSESEYLDSQTDYVVILYQTRNKKWNRTQINNLRKNIRNMLQKEHDTFKFYAKEFEKEVSAELDIFEKRNTDELREYILQMEKNKSIENDLTIDSDLANDSEPHRQSHDPVDSILSEISTIDNMTDLPITADSLLE